MFFEESLINSLLICSECERKFVDPRVLPCGKSVCQECVHTLANTDTGLLKCRSCGKIHEIPHEGFPANQELAKLVTIEPKEVERSKLATKFKTLANSIHEKAKKLALEFEIIDVKISGMCAQIRNKTQLAIEEAHLKLDSIHSEFMEEIQAYETKCGSNLNAVKQDKASLSELLDQSSVFVAESHSLLKKYVLDDKELKKALDDGNSLLNSLEKASSKLECDIFGETMLTFAKNQKELGSDLIGQLKWQNRELAFLDNLSNV